MKVKLQARQIWVAALRGMILCMMVLSAAAQEGRKLIVQAPPTYPAIAKSIRLAGTVKVQVIIGTDGQIKETKVLGGHPVLVDATLEALKKWKYAPSQAQTTAQLEFNFHP